MTKHVIFLIHGVGSYTKKVTDAAGENTFQLDQKGWFGSCEKQLVDIFDNVIAPSSRIYKDKKFTDLFKVVPILYDDLFEKYRHAWAKQAGSWTKFEPVVNAGLSGDQSLITGIQKFLAGANEDNFGWANIADAVMYQSLLVQQAVISTVQRQVLGALVTEKPTKFSFIAHSLGTRVLHDVWDALALDPRIRNASIANSSGLNVVCMLSNVVQALYKGGGNVNSQALKPNPTSTQTWSSPSIYINANHEYDFISKIDPMPRPDGWPSNGFYELSNLELVFDLKPSESDRSLTWNDIWVPHQFNNYMLQPDLAALLWKALLGQDDGWAQNIKKAFDAYSGGKSKLATVATRTIEKRLVKVLSKYSSVSDKTLATFASMVRDFI
jgi:hypothetical protein